MLCCQQPTIFCSSAKICLPEVHYFEVSSFHFLSCTTLFINTFSEWVHTKRYYLCTIGLSNWTNRNMYCCLDFRMLKLFQNKKDQTWLFDALLLNHFVAASSWLKFFKSYSKHSASQQTFGPSYFVAALGHTFKV